MHHRNIKVLNWFNFFSDFKLYAPIAIIYFAQVSGSFALGMTVFSIAMVSAALFEIPTGIYSDFIGRKKTVILGALAAVIFSIFYAIGQSFWVLAAGAVFEGLSRSFYSGNNDALLYNSLAETKEENQYDEVLGKISSMFQASLAIAGVLGGILASWSFPLIMWISVVPQMVCLSLGFLLSEPKANKRQTGNVYYHLKEAVLNFFKNKKLRLLSISSILTYGIGEASFHFQAAFYNTLWPVWAIGIAKTLSYTGGFLSFRFSGKIIRRYGAIQALIASYLYNRIANVIAVLFPTIISPILMSSTSLLFGVSSVAKSDLLQKEFTNEQRATMGSINSFAGSIFFGVIATSLGFIADKVSPAVALFAFQIVLFPTIFLYLRFLKHQKSDPI